MYVMDYTKGKGWHDPRIVPYQPIVLEPSAMVFHYGQEMFEGLKAYKTEDGRTLLFRPDKNIERANNSNRRLMIPEIDPEDFLNAIRTLVKTDEAWTVSYTHLEQVLAKLICRQNRTDLPSCREK